MTSTGVEQGRHILVADDEEPVRLVSRRMLERRGFRVTATHDGREVVEYVRRRPESYDLVLLDVTMPGQSCGETVEQLKTAAPNLPIVLCSGLTGEESELKETRDRVQGFLRKPFRYQELLEAIENALC